MEFMAAVPQLATRGTAGDCGKSKVRPCVSLVQMLMELSGCPVQSAWQCGGPVTQEACEVMSVFSLVFNSSY